MSETVESYPEKYGLKTLAYLGEEGLSYEYNTLIVWTDDEGKLYWARDRGCSCPIPFEYYDSIEKLAPITSDTFDAFAREVMNFPNMKKVQVLSQVAQLVFTDAAQGEPAPGNVWVVEEIDDDDWRSAHLPEFHKVSGSDRSKKAFEAPESLFARYEAAKRELYEAWGELSDCDCQP